MSKLPIYTDIPSPLTRTTEYPSPGRCFLACCLYAVVAAVGWMPQMTDLDILNIYVSLNPCDKSFEELYQIGAGIVLHKSIMLGIVLAVMVYFPCILVTRLLLRFPRRFWLQGVLPLVVVAGGWYVAWLALLALCTGMDAGPEEYEGHSLLFLHWGMSPETADAVLAWLQFPLILVLPYSAAQWYLLRR